VLDPARRAKDPREKYRRGIEAGAIGHDAGRNVVSRLRTFDHDSAHETLLVREAASTDRYPNARMRRLFDASKIISRFWLTLRRRGDGAVHARMRGNSIDFDPSN
jgi:hypothetical protein